MSAPGPGSTNESALADYLDELLDAGGDAPAPVQHDLDTDAAGTVVAAGPIVPADERHYLFDLAGLTLALPAARICAELRPALDCVISNSGATALASLPQGGQCRLLDLADLLLAGHPALQQAAAAQAAGASLLLDDRSWGFQVSAPGALQRLDLDQVQWRGHHSRRPWLAGTWAARRLVLLDLDGLAGLLE